MLLRINQNLSRVRAPLVIRLRDGKNRFIDNSITQKQNIDSTAAIRQYDANNATEQTSAQLSSRSIFSRLRIAPIVMKTSTKESSKQSITTTALRAIVSMGSPLQHLR
jgi:hypothetical protein